MRIVLMLILLMYGVGAYAQVIPNQLKSKKSQVFSKSKQLAQKFASGDFERQVSSENAIYTGVAVAERNIPVQNERRIVKQMNVNPVINNTNKSKDLVKSVVDSKVSTKQSKIEHIAKD